MNPVTSLLSLDQEYCSDLTRSLSQPKTRMINSTHQNQSNYKPTQVQADTLNNQSLFNGNISRRLVK